MTVDKGLSFRVEATPHEGVGSKGLSVKVKVRKKQDAGTQYDAILKFKKADLRDRTIHLVQSEQTMTSFDMLVEKQKPTVYKRGSFFRNFKPGGCLDPPLDEDRNKYTLKKEATPKSSKSSLSLKSKKSCKYNKHGSQCVDSKKEDKEHPIEKSSSASVMSLFKAVPASSLNVHSSNNIITYPIHAKRSKVSISSSKKSIDEKRKKSFNQTTELYFKPKGDETGTKSPSTMSKVSKKNISREGHKSVDSDMLPYIQEIAKAQTLYIQDDPISAKKDVQTISDPEIRQGDSTIADFNNNRRNEILTGQSTLSDSSIKPLNINSEKTDHVANSIAAGLPVSGLAAVGLAAAGLAAAANVSDEPQIMRDFAKPTSPSKEASIEDIKSTSVLSKHDAIQIRSKVSGDISASENAPKRNEISKKTPNDDLKSKLILENTSITTTNNATLVDDKNTESLFDETKIQTHNEGSKMDFKALKVGAEVFSDIENKDFIKKGSTDKRIETKPTDTESLRQEHDNNVTTILDVPKTEGAIEEGRDLATSTPINKDDAQKSDLPRSKNASVISLAKDINERSFSKLVAGSNLSTLSQIHEMPSSDNKIATKDSIVNSSPRGSEKSLKLTPIESQASTHNATNVFPLHKATSNHSTDHGDFLNTSPPIKSNFSNSEKQIIDDTILATDVEMITKSDAKIADIKSQLAFEPQTVLPSSISSTTPLHQGTETASSHVSTTADIAQSTFVPSRSYSNDESIKMATQGSLLSITAVKAVSTVVPPGSYAGDESTNMATQGSVLSTTSDKALSTVVPPRSYSGELSTNVATQGSFLNTTADKALSTFVPLMSYSGDESTKIAIQGSLLSTTIDEVPPTVVPYISNLEDESTKIAKQDSLEGSQTRNIDLMSPYIRTSLDKGDNTKSQFLQDTVSEKLGSLDKFVREAKSQLDDNIIVAKRSSDIRDFMQSVKHKQDSIDIKDYTETSKDESRVSIDKPAQTENMALSNNTVLRTGDRPLRDSIISSLAPSIDIDQTDQFLVDIAFEFSRNGAAKQTIIKSVDAESASNQLSRPNNIISHKSTTTNPFEHPIEIPINPQHSFSLKLNQRPKTSKDKRKAEKKQSRSSFDITPIFSNKVQKHGIIGSNTRRKGIDFNIVLETIYKEQLQPLEKNMKKLKAEILLLTQEQTSIQRSINNLTEKRSSLRTSRGKRSLSCLCKRNIPNTLQYPSFTMQ